MYWMQSNTNATGLASQQGIESRFFAHSTDDPGKSNWHPLAQHLKSTGELAAQRAAAFGGEQAARLQGELHDLGKYTQSFQRRLAGDLGRVDHATWGAKIIAERYGQCGQLLAYGIAGHHAGLANGQGQGERIPLASRLAATDLDALDPAWERDIALPPKLTLPALKAHPDRKQFQYAFLTRMLFSCLVDADFIDTENFYLALKGGTSARAEAYPTLEELRSRLDTYLGGFALQGRVNPVRARILNHARAQAHSNIGLFSLTAPTGGGKTLTSLAFALDHAIHHGLRRIIFVIPFTSIIEQNAAVFRQAFGDLGKQAVLEHHSAFVEQSTTRSDSEKYQANHKLRLAMENWDAPVVVTTAVQFFESLFAARPSQCRKLHSIAGSVVVLDEAQTMPLKLLRPCVAVIDELARNYRTSVVLCTATQPALENPNFRGGLENVRELAPDPPRLFKELERIRVRRLGVLDDASLTQHLRDREQLLCIVNNRHHARTLYQFIQDLPGALHLSTWMCAKHRSDVLEQVRKKLRDGQPCRLVTTSLIEAGVDVDFPTVLRAEAGLDSIAQAAGRCNREGRRDRDASEVLVFATANDDWAPPPDLRQFAQVAHEVLRRHTDPLAPDAIREYFNLLYWQRGDEQLDKHGLLQLLKSSQMESLPMESLAKKFRMIDDAHVTVIISYDEEARAALKKLGFVQGCMEPARELQPYGVQISRKVADALRQAHAVQYVEPEKWNEQFLMLVNMDLYANSTGLSWDNPNFINAENLVC